MTLERGIVRQIVEIRGRWTVADPMRTSSRLCGVVGATAALALVVAGCPSQSEPEGEGDAAEIRDTGPEVERQCSNPQDWYRDDDGDSYGTTDETRRACERPAGFVANSGECDDSDPGIRPGAEEQCDGNDTDCDGTVDDGLTTECSRQQGVCKGAVVRCREGSFPECGASQFGADYQAGDESSCDGLDNDCDGNTDEGVERDCPLQAGVCSGATVACTDGSFPACGMSDYGPSYELQELSEDGDDNDCDGRVDNVVATREWGTDADGEYAQAVDYYPSQGWIYVAYSGTRELAKFEGTGDLDQIWTRYTGISPGGVASYGGGVYTGGEGTSNPLEFDLQKTSHADDSEWDEGLDSADDTSTRDVAVNPHSGDVYVVGWAEGEVGLKTHSGKKDILIGKFDEEGNNEWVRLLGQGDDDIARAAAVDPTEGTLYVAGETDSELAGRANPGGTSPFLVRYTSSGSRDWVEVFGPSKTAVARGVAFDSAEGSVFVSGTSSGDMGNEAHAGAGDGFVAKYGESGGRKWINLIGTGVSEHHFGGVAVDEPDREVYIAGGTFGPLAGNTNNGGEDVAVVKYDTSGSRQWVRLYGTSFEEQGRDLAVDPETSDFYVVGQSSANWDTSCSDCGGKSPFLIRRKD